MAKKKRKSSKENPENQQGQTNLGFEPCETENIVKTRSKEDISTLNKNLTEDNETKPKVTKKKKFKSDSERIENDLFEGEPKKRSKKKRSSKKAPTKADTDTTTENIELAPLGNEAEEEEEEEINVLLDKKKKSKKKSSRKSSVQHELKELPLILPSKTDDSEDKENQVLGVFVHYADCLKLDFYVLHPIVKVSLVDLGTGRLIHKSDKSRKVTSYYEGDHISHIVQLMTQPYDFKEKRSIVPRWEELLLFNEDPEYLKGFGSNWGIFFEIVDFIRMSSVNNESWRTKDPHSTGWHPIAWAFLKPVPSRIHSNLNQRLRLQLYKPQSIKSNKNSGEESEVWKWWSQCPHVTYPSSLHVTIEAVNPPERNQPTIRSMGPLQPEQGSSDAIHTQSIAEANAKNVANPNSPPRVVLWTRLPGQTCKIPDQNLYEFKLNGKGGWCLKFSTDGKSLAVAGPNPPLGSSVRVYSVETGQLEIELHGHKGPIYDLDWHRNNRLLSASGDGSVRIWSSNSSSKSAPRKEESVLQHPTYVYAARFHPNDNDTIASAGYDQVVRIWYKSDLNFVILHELVNHQAFVNCLEFDIDGQVLFSGDQAGAIRVWESSSTDHWYLKKSLDFREIQGNSIMALSIHPGGRRLLVHSRSLSNNVIMVDLKLHTIMQTFVGSQSFKGHVSSCITPCGTYVISSSQDGAVYVWNADNGAQAHLYTCPLGELAAKAGVVINCIHFSPTDHIIAFSGMVSNGQASSKMGSSTSSQFTAPVYVYKNKVNSSSHLMRKTLPSLELSTPKETNATGEKFKNMIEQLDRMILDEQEILQIDD